MSGREPIRSYQRIFRPDRRLHHIEGRALPIPGGIPLRGLGYAGSALLGVLALGTGSLFVYVLVASMAALAGAALGGRQGAATAGAIAFAASFVAGHVLGALDWPIRFVMVPAAVAMVGTQSTPDGRPAHRFAVAWLALRLSPRRRSFGRALPAEDTPLIGAGEVHVSPDQHSPILRRSRIVGEGAVVFAEEVAARRSRLRQRRIVVSSPGHRERRGEVRTRRLALTPGERAEVRP